MEKSTNWQIMGGMNSHFSSLFFWRHGFRVAILSIKLMKILSEGFPVERKWPWEIWTNYNSIISLYCAKNTYVRYNKTLCVQCNVVYYRYNVLQNISRIYFSCLTETSCPIINNFLFDHQPDPWQSSLHIFILEFDCCSY